MTVFFNIAALEEKSGGDIKKFLRLFEGLVEGRRIRKHLTDPDPKMLIGTSFLLNAKPLLKYSGDPIHVIQYIKLAALRDYFLYKQYAVTYVDLSYYPDINTPNIKHNPLIKIEDNKVFFKFER